MADSPPLAYPAQPTTLDEAKAYLTWVGDAALRGLLPRDAARDGTKAIEAWLRAEGFARQIADLKRQITALAKAAKRDG